MKWFFNNFHWEPDNWWWELVRFDEFGLSRSWDFQVPDKLYHFLTCFLFTWMLFKLGMTRSLSAFLPWFIMIVPWEIFWDGCFRYGASWKDMAADTLGALVAWWWLGSYNVVGQVSDLPK